MCRSCAPGPGAAGFAGAEASGRVATRSRKAPSTRGSSTRDTANCGMTPAARAARFAGTGRAAAAPAGSDAPSAARVAPAILERAPHVPDSVAARGNRRARDISSRRQQPHIGHALRENGAALPVHRHVRESTPRVPGRLRVEAISNTTSVPSSESPAPARSSCRPKRSFWSTPSRATDGSDAWRGGDAHEQRTETEQRPERHLVCVRAMIDRSHVARIVHDREPHGVGAGRDGHVDREGQAIAGCGAELLFSRDDLPALLIAQRRP